MLLSQAALLISGDGPVPERCCGLAVYSARLGLAVETDLCEHTFCNQRTAPEDGATPRMSAGLPGRPSGGRVLGSGGGAGRVGGGRRRGLRQGGGGPVRPGLVQRGEPGGPHVW